MLNSERPPIDKDLLPRMLHAGMGRAVLYLLQQDLREYRDMILDACLHNQVLDMQVDGTQAVYLYTLIKYSSEVDFYREKIIDALVEVTEIKDAVQLFDFAVLFAKDGYSRAREVAYQKFIKNDIEDGEYDGAYQLIEMDGIYGLMFVLDVLGAAEYKSYIIEWLISEVEEILGIEAVYSTLVKAAAENENIKTALEIAEYPYSEPLITAEIRQSGRRGDAADWRRRREEEDRGLSWEEVKERETNNLSFWARQAPEEELIKVAEDLIRESDPEKIKMYLRIFFKRIFPLQPEHLIEFLNAEDEMIQNCAASALSNMKHPQVRRLFFEWYEKPELAWAAVVFLKRNYIPGDYQFIEALFENEKNPDSLHSICYSTIDVFSNNPLPELLPSLMLVYNQSPCTYCRDKSVDLMHSITDLPHWLIEESVYDANDDLRAFAKSQMDNCPPD